MKTISGFKKNSLFVQICNILHKKSDDDNNIIIKMSGQHNEQTNNTGSIERVEQTK